MVLTQWPGEPMCYGPEGEWSELFLIYPPTVRPALDAAGFFAPDRCCWPVRSPERFGAAFDRLFRLVFEGDPEANIDRETWDQVQVMLKSNMNHDSSRRTPKVNPFNGMIYCGSCGGAFSLSHTVKQGNKRYSYYICLEDIKRNFSTCPVKRVPANELEKLVLREIGILFQTPTMLAQLMNKGDLGISANQLQTVLKNIYEVWEVMNPAERCKLIQCVITRITVYETHIEIRPNLDGIKTLLIEAGMEV